MTNLTGFLKPVRFFRRKERATGFEYHPLLGTRRIFKKKSGRRDSNIIPLWGPGGYLKRRAGDGIRTRGYQLGRLMPYHLATPAMEDLMFLKWAEALISRSAPTYGSLLYIDCRSNQSHLRMSIASLLMQNHSSKQFIAWPVLLKYQNTFQSATKNLFVMTILCYNGSANSYFLEFTPATRALTGKIPHLN